MELLVLIIQIFSAMLLFRTILTEQELLFNSFGRALAKVTEPVLRTLRIPVRHIGKAAFFIILALFLIAGLLGGSLLGGAIAFARFMAAFFIVCVLLGSIASPQGGSFPMFFYRLGAICVRPVQRVTGIRTNAVVIPTIIAILALLWMTAAVACMLQFANSEIAPRFASREVLGLFASILQNLALIIVARAIMSWVSPDRSNPVVQIIYFITEPVLSPLRRVIPTVGFLDISTLAAIAIIAVLNMLLYKVSAFL